LFTRKRTTINFEGNEIRALVTRRNKVIAWQTQKLPLEEAGQGLISDTSAAADAVLAMLKDIKGSKTNLVTCISGQRAVHRVMRVPEIPERMLEETIERKARQEFAIPVDDTDLFWRIINRADNQILLYVLAIPRVIIDQHVEILAKAKIKPRIMDIKALALQRLVNQNTALIANLEVSSMEVIIVVNHIPLLVRTIPLDSGDLTGEAKVDLLSQELARTVKYYNESHKNNRLPEDTPIYLSGALFSTLSVEARLGEGTNLIERFQARTPFPLKPPKSPLELPDKFPLLRYAVNLGLAIKASK
jgi:hypothetical protein